MLVNPYHIVYILKNRGICCGEVSNIDIGHATEKNR